MRREMIIGVQPVLRLLCAAAVFAVAVHAADAAEVRVFAAASLTNALTEIGTAWEREERSEIVLHFAATSTLRRQISSGAPAEIFLAADSRSVDALAIEGLVTARVDMLSNALVIIVPARGGRELSSPRSLASVRSIALADPAIVPAGVYARSYLTRAGVWTEVAPKVIPTDNVRAALAAVASGNADAAIVYRTDARISPRVRISHVADDAAAPQIVHSFATLKGAGEPARRFFAYLQTPAARAIFGKHGFIVR